MTDKIQKAYRSSKNIYDNVLTQKSFLSRLYINLIWHGVDDNVIADKVLSCIPDDFSGSLLDVPVGTAVFTEKKWRALKRAKIVGSRRHFRQRKRSEKNWKKNTGYPGSVYGVR